MQSALHIRRFGCAAVAAAIITVSSSVAGAERTVPGEKWQQSMSIKMQGMSMPMGNHEICAPIGRGDEELLKPEKNCKVSNVKRAGNRLSGDIECTGKDAMKGTMVMVSDGEHMTGTMQMTMEGQTVTMAMDSKKLGACQAVDTQALAGQAQAQAARAGR